MTTFRSFKHRNYRLHFTGQAISLIGTWMQRVAISWLVYRITESAFMLGFISFLSLIPALVLAPFAGNFVDRKNKYKIVVWCQIIFMLQAGVLALLVWLKHYDMTVIGVLSLIQGITTSYETTARQSLVVDLVDDKDDLSNAISLNSSAFNAARLVGPAVAGIVLSTYGEQACFIINFISFAPVIICLLLMKLNLQSHQQANGDILEKFREGWRYLQQSPQILNLIVVSGFSSLLAIPFSTLLPVFAKDIFHGNASTFSWFESAGGLGALFGALYMASLKKGKDLEKIVMIALVVFGLGLLALALSPMVNLALLATGLACAGMMTQTAAINTFIQTHTDNAYRGRIISYFLMAYQGILPIGTLLIGYLAHYLGTKIVVFSEGIIALLIVGVYAYHRRNHPILKVAV